MRRSALSLLAVGALAAGATASLPSAVIAHPADSAVDQDHDAVRDPPFGNDNCAGEDGAYNPRQEDLDGDGLGDACDTDDDGDTIDDAVDNCPQSFNAQQGDLDGDAIGDVCDTDDDGDGFADGRDNCRFVANPGQTDGDRDGLGDACDTSTPGGASNPPPTFTGDTTVPGPPDTTAPNVAVTLGSRHRAGELGAGLAVPVSCSERCTIASALTISARDARRLKLRSRTLGSGGAELEDAGATFVFVDLPTGALRRVRGSVRAVLKLDVTDAAGNRRTISKRIAIRR
ncbi:MAG TPA: thrombospondin type 3 repeat-containing protein [Solirubrobacteraceae bacterium]